MACVRFNGRRLDALTLAPAALMVTVGRAIGGKFESVFTYAGGVDAAIADAVLQHVERLTVALPGEWRLDAVASSMTPQLLRQVREGFRSLRRFGVRQQLSVVHGRMLPERRRASFARAVVDAPGR